MPPRKTEVQRYRAKHAFGVMYEGEHITISQGEVIRAGHPLLSTLGRAGCAEHLEPVDTFGRFDVDVEQATAAPGETR